MQGKWPTCDWNGVPFEATDRERFQKAGQPLCGPYRFALFQLAADLDYLCNCLGLSHFNSATSPCFKCRCDRAGVPWTDLKPTAVWWQHGVSMAYWYLSEKHMVFESPRVGLNLFHICLDLLHIIDLGIAQHICGSIIHMLVFDTGLPGRCEDKMLRVWDAMCTAYQSLRTPAGEMLPHPVFCNIFAKSRTANPTVYPELHSECAQASIVWQLSGLWFGACSHGHPQVRTTKSRTSASFGSSFRT